MLYGYGNAGEAYCRCECECGKEIIKSSYGIRHSRNPAHCGCKTEYYRQIQANNARIDLTGHRFGRLVVQKMIYQEKHISQAVCLCDCGTIVTKPITYLTSGDTTSCGCYQKEQASKSNTKDFTGIISSYGVEFIQPDYKNEKGQWIWRCKCGKCQKTFTALPAKVLNGHTTSCGCTRQSAGERLIETLLIKLKVIYKTEYVLKDCKNIHPLRLDFYLPEYNIGIEYNGSQHYEPNEYFGGIKAFELRERLDEQKRNYCKENHITLIELPYTLSNEEIENIITNIIYPERLSCSA